MLSILALNGSLRAGSYNGHLLRAAIELAPAEMTIAVHPIAGLPLYDADVQAGGEPEPVASLRMAIARSRGLLIVSPEYNYSVPGGLKNAIDWVSRPPATSPFQKKPVGIMGASQGVSGTMRMQIHLRSIVQGIGMIAMPKPEVVVTHCRDKFDAEGRLTDTATREHVTAFMAAFLAWCLRT
jgi:chromate reductase, NAD(P)H dehydrogenase (quinone)